jgi:hypothetical protein
MIAATQEAVLQCVVDALPVEPDRSRDAHALLNQLLTDDDALQMPLRDLDLLPGGKALDAPLSSLSDRVKKLTSPKSGTPRRWGGSLQEIAVIRAGLNAGAGSPIVLPVAWLLVRERVGDLSDISATMQDLLSYQGLWRLGIADVILPTLGDMLKRGISIREAALELTARTVSHHLNIAWGRMESDPRRDVSVICADGNQWSRHNSFRANRTASRLPEATGWLVQLGLIDDSGCTSDGEAVLSHLSRRASAAGAE